MRNQSSKGHELPSIRSQLCMDSDDWQCIQIHNVQNITCGTSTPWLRRQISEYPCMSLIVSRQVTKPALLSPITHNYVIDILLFRLPNFLQKGLGELWVQVGRGTTTRFVPLRILHTRLGSGDLYTFLPAPRSLTGCDITSNIGTKKVALNAEKRSTCTDLAQRLH